VELGVEEIDLVADDEGAARLEDPLLHRQPVVGLSDRQHTDVGMLGHELAADLHRAIARAVLAQQELVAPAEATQLLFQLQHRAAQDPLLVVDGDDDREVRRAVAHAKPPSLSMSAATSRPASTQSSIAL